MSLYAGIDLSSNAIDICLLDEETLAARWIRRRLDGNSSHDAFHRARVLRDVMPARSTWRDLGVIAIGIEKPMARNPHGIVPQMRAQGALLACLPAELTIYELVPATWKKLALGNGHASKADGKAWVQQHVTWSDAGQALPQDAHDAACIARAAQLRDYSERGIAAA